MSFWGKIGNLSTSIIFGACLLLFVTLPVKAQDCIDPDLSRIVEGTEIMMCNGTLAAGTLKVISDLDITQPFTGPAFVTSIANAPTAADICLGSNFLGVSGDKICLNLRSSLWHDVGEASLIPIASEFEGQNFAQLHTSGHRAIPDFSKDHDGWSTFNSAGRDLGNEGDEWENNGSTITRKACGMGLASLDARIADCDTRHTTKPAWDTNASDGVMQWDGPTVGTNTEVTWTLVTIYKSGGSNGDTCDLSCREVWRDDVTGFIWSDELGDRSDTDNVGDYNWCHASGANNKVSSPFASDDPDDYCDGVNATACGGASCQSQTTPISLCAEDATWLHTPTGITDTTTYEFDAAKGGMRATADYDSSGSSPKVYWRLPTLEDYNIAFAHGLVFVTPTNHANKMYFTATVSSYSTVETISVNSRYDSYNDNQSRAGFRRVRCIGRYPQ